MVLTLEVEAATCQNLLDILTIDKQKDLRTDALRVHRRLNTTDFYTWLSIAFYKLTGNQEKPSVEVGKQLAAELGLNDVRFHSL